METMLSSLFSRTKRLSLFHSNTISVVGFIRSASFAIKPSSEASLSCDDPQKGRSFVVSYLVNSCGLSPQAAVSVSSKNKLNFRSSQNPDSVLALLTKHGLSKTQISKLVRTRPKLLNFNPEKTLLPKIQFLSSIGVSGTELACIISANPILLESCLEKRLVPCHNFLKSVAHLQDKQVIAAFKRRAILTSDIRNTFTPNVALLRQLGVPQSSISFLFTNFPQTFAVKHSRFAKAVEDARQMRFDPSKNSFVLAVYVFYTMTDSKWESKYEIFGKWGWSKDDTIQAFKKFPLIMHTSDKKVLEVFDFLVNKMEWAWASKHISQCPSILSYSLEKNIVPKCYVIHVLRLKGLIEQDFRLGTIITKGEKYFLDKYVTRYGENVPQLLNLYKRKVDLQECI